MPLNRRGLLIAIGLCITAYSSGQSMERGDALKLAAQKLLDEAYHFFNSQTINKACAVFVTDQQWRRGPLSLFVLDDAGRVYADNGHSSQLWRHYQGVSNFYGEPLMSHMLSVPHQGGWVSYPLLQSIRHAFVKKVFKDGQTYVLGAAFFDESPYLMSQLLVDSIIRYWVKLGMYKTVELTNNPLGPLVRGALYGIVIDMQGTCYAHGHNLLLVGQNIFNPALVGQEKAKAFKEVVRVLKRPLNEADEQPAWWVTIEAADAYGRRLKERLYCKRFVDIRLRKEFIIISGYATGITPRTIESIADTIELLLKKEPLEAFMIDMTSIFSRAKRHLLPNGINLTIMEPNGKIRFTSSFAERPGYVGGSVIDYVDEQRRPFNRLLLEQLKQRAPSEKPSAWVTRFNKHAVERIYGRSVQTSQGMMVLQLLGYYPTSERELVEILVLDASEFMKKNACSCSLRAFADESSPFVQGDKQIMVYDAAGICWVHGISPEAIWKKDASIAQLLEGWAHDSRLRSPRELYTMKIMKDKETFTIGSSYYPLEGEIL